MNTNLILFKHNKSTIVAQLGQNKQLIVLNVPQAGEEGKAELRKDRNLTKHDH